MSLRDAIKISNVAIYQELARRIGWNGCVQGEEAEYGNARSAK
jgi:beta-lactamase class D